MFLQVEVAAIGGLLTLTESTDMLIDTCRVWSMVAQDQ